MLLFVAFLFLDVIVGFAMTSRNVSVTEDMGNVLLTVEASGSLEETISLSVAATNGQASSKTTLLLYFPYSFFFNTQDLKN